MKKLFCVTIICLLTACGSTPKTALQAKSGEIINCGGGGIASYGLGGITGMAIQREIDEKCVNEAKAKGFDVIYAEPLPPVKASREPDYIKR